jgi:uncharacterized phage protein (TIGR01671 family)
MYYHGFWVSCNYPNSDGDICFDRDIFKSGKYNPLKIQITQFTGLKDKDWKDIYEGDILKAGDYICVVNWNEKFASFCVNKKGWMFSHFFEEHCETQNVEVIGNIYENPELLKEE